VQQMFRGWVNYHRRLWRGLRLKDGPGSAEGPLSVPG
jgi:hypothetical protein